MHTVSPELGRMGNAHLAWGATPATEKIASRELVHDCVGYRRDVAWAMLYNESDCIAVLLGLTVWCLRAERVPLKIM